MSGAMFSSKLKMHVSMKSMIVKVFSLFLMTSQTSSFVPSHSRVNKVSTELYSTLSKQDLEDILEGATFLAAGGGGPKDIGKAVLHDLLRSKKTVTLLDPTEDPSVSGDEYLTVLGGVGSPQAAGTALVDNKNVFTLGSKRVFDYMEKLMSLREKNFTKIDYICPVEIGAVNTMIALMAAAETNSSIIDADGMGRSVPNFNLTAYDAAGVSVSPTTVANSNPDNSNETEPVTAGFDVKKAYVVETCIRSLLNTTEFNPAASLATWTMTVEKLRTCMTANTISLAREVGETLRTTTDSNLHATNVVELLRKRGRYAKLLFKGKVMDIEKKTRNTLDFNELSLFNRKTGKSATIEGENENLIMYENHGNVKTPICIGPDSVCFLKEGTSIDFTNLTQGMEIDVIGIQAYDSYVKIPKILQNWENLLSLYGNYTKGYVPLETLSKQNKEKVEVGSY